MIVSILGVLKSRGAYVPLDPAYPKERLSFLLSEFNAKLILTQQCLAENLPEQPTKKIFIDKDWDQISLLSRENLNNCASANNLAYVIFTSGSTGKPKGVMIEHHSPINLLTGLNNAIYYESMDFTFTC